MLFGLLLQLEVAVQNYSTDSGQDSKELIGCQGIPEHQKPTNESHAELAVPCHVIAVQLVQEG